MGEKKRIYCISGLGTDEKVFHNLEIDGYSLEYLPWITHNKNETLRDYSLRMAEQINDSQPVILGLSLGAMIGIEIARHKPVKKLIIISGVKTRRELPPWMRLAGTLQLNKWMPVRSNRITKRYDNKMLGVSSPQEENLADLYRKKLDKSFQAWAINQILNWKNNWYPKETIHIHGENDKLFPVKNISSSIIIKEGTHIMILNKAKEVSECIARQVTNEFAHSVF